MTAKLVKGSEPIVVKQLGMVAYGEPGSRKTSLAQTGKNPITLAADPGVYRCYGRKDAYLFETWQDIMDVDTSGYSEVVVDTVATAMGYLARALVAESPKNGNRQGGLSLPGYGMLAEKFACWVSAVKAKGADLIFICHEDSEKRGDELYHTPAVVGQKFYAELMRHSDLIGYMHFDNGRQVIDWAPTDRWMAKAPPCGWTTMQLPDFAQEPQFLANLLAQAKASMGLVSQASSAVAKLVEQYQLKFDADPALDAFNAFLADLPGMEQAAKVQIWHAMKQHAPKAGWVFDAQAKLFVPEKQPEKAPEGSAA